MPNITTNNNVDWFYEIEGEGDEVLMFIHGWGVDRRIWKQQTKFFSQHYKVIAIDLPGHGNSSWKKLQLIEIVKDIKIILEKERIDKVSIIGSSLGGLVGLKCYEVFPGKINRLVFVGSMPKFSQSKDNPYGLNVDEIRKLESQLNVKYPSIVNIFFRSLFTREERESRRFKWIQRFRQNDDTPMKDALIEYLDILENEDLRKVLKKADIPVQFINGTEDSICNINVISSIEELAPNAQFDFFHRCGHFPFLSKPYEFNEILWGFLKK